MLHSCKKIRSKVFIRGYGKVPKVYKEQNKSTAKIKV